MRNYLWGLICLGALLRRAYWDRKRISEYQNKKLRGIVKYAYNNVPFYHRKLKALGLVPDDIKTTSDLNKLPILRKSEIRANLNQMISREFAPDTLQMLSTSGSTGQPLFFYLNGREDAFRKAKHLRANISLGQKARDSWVTITSPHHFGNSTRLQRILRLYTPTFVSIFDDTAKQASRIEKMQPALLDGYSSSLLLLANELKRTETYKIKPRFVIGGAELIDDEARRQIEKTFNAPFYDQYACVELERIAWQCKEKAGYHIDTDTILVQFVDDNGEEASKGEKGEIICTSLFNYSMPLIRYAVGDLGIASEEQCRCGRTLPLMKAVEGRKDSLLYLPDGRILTPRAMTIAISMFEMYDLIDKFRVVQKKKDYLELLIKTRKEDVDKDVFARRLNVHMRKMLAFDSSQIGLEVRFVEDIPLDRTGKFTIVVSNLDKQRAYSAQ